MPPRNQYKPFPPTEELVPHIHKYWKMRKTDKEILQLLHEKHIDTEKYGIGLSSFKRLRESIGLTGTRGQKHGLETIKPFMIALRKRYPKAGARDMVSLLFHEHGMSVSRLLVGQYFRVYERSLIRVRKQGRLKRRRFWSAGVNDIWAVDQHDKWKRFGLALHTGIDPFSGETKWMKIWWNNNNPKLILSYYLGAVEETGYMPLITQSDPGSENYGIANAQTVLRQWHDPKLKGSIQHRWMRQKKNVMPEIAWSQLRRRFTPGFENILQLGVTNGWYDLSRPVDALTFRWLFIPWLQAELDAWTDRINHTKKRADRNKILPHGPPKDISSSPERYGCLDFKIGPVDEEALNHVRDVYAPPGDPIFELVPAEFDHYANHVYEAIGSPDLTSDNIWDVYLEMRDQLERYHESSGAEHDSEHNDYLERWEIQESLMNDDNVAENPCYDLVQGQDLAGGIEHMDEDGYYYMGGVNGGHGLDSAQRNLLDAMDEDNNDIEFESDDDTDSSEESFEGIAVHFSSDEDEQAKAM